MQKKSEEVSREYQTELGLSLNTFSFSVYLSFSVVLSVSLLSPSQSGLYCWVSVLYQQLEGGWEYRETWPSSGCPSRTCPYRSERQSSRGARIAKEEREEEESAFM